MRFIDSGSPQDMASPNPAEHDNLDIDPSEPFKHIVVCCTSIPHEYRTDLANKVAELGGVHKYDLTPDVTHLIVGDYDTPKYRHVAKERPDVKAMDAHWVDAVNELWKNDDHLDFAALETSHQLRPLETSGIQAASQHDDSNPARGSLLICLTGFGDQREDIADTIRNAGGRHTGDLTKRCTHLIAHKPEGKKFTAAKQWGVLTVTLDWLAQSIERGMILDEKSFDPLLPAEEQGVGAWTRRSSSQTTLGKRSRSAAIGNGAAATTEDGARKLRKTASMKLSSQTSHIWGDILGRPGSAEQLVPRQEQSHRDYSAQASAEVPTQPNHPPIDTDKGVFANCTFVVHGFPQQRATILEQTITTMGGSVVPAASHPSLTPESEHTHFLIVPQSSQPDTHPKAPHDKVHIMTEFYIENCLHNKRFVSPDEHVLGRPFPRFPIPSFADLTICSAAFTGIELNHVSRSVTQLGAKYEEAFRRTASVLVCKSLQNVRKEKLKLALDWGVPVVPGDWLWQCISTGFLAPTNDFVYPELKPRYPKRVQSSEHAQDKRSQPGSSARVPHKAASSSASASSKPPVAAGVDATAFERDPAPGASRRALSANSTFLGGNSVTANDFSSAPSRSAASSHPPFTGGTSFLAEVSSATLNKSFGTKLKPLLPSRPLRDPFAQSDSDEDPLQPPSPRKDHLASAAPDHPSNPKDPAQTKDPSKTQDQYKTRDPSEKENHSKPEDPSIDAAAAAAAAARAAKDDHDRKLRIGLTTALSTLIPASDLASSSLAQDPPAPPRRRRTKIMGRAVSNVSATSSAAADADACSFRGGGGGGGGREDARPPATQLGYEDAEARGHKAALMSKMAAREKGASSV